MADTIDILQKLIETCRDGQNGYRDAAERTQDPELRRMFNEASLERATFAGELENEVQHLGKSDPKREGSTSAAMHRAWFDIKQKLGGGDKGIVNEVERGEDVAKASYEDAMKADLPEGIRQVVARQAERVFADHDRAKALKERYKDAA